MNKAKKKVVSKRTFGNITPEFRREVNKFMDEHHDVLRELAKR